MNVLTSLLDVIGLAAVVYGFGLIWPPLWWIAGGIAMLIVDWRLS